MAQRSVKVWFDPEGDFLEVTLDAASVGYFRETADDRVMQRVDEHGNLLGFSVLGVSSITVPLPFELPALSAIDGE